MCVGSLPPVTVMPSMNFLADAMLLAEADIMVFSSQNLNHVEKVIMLKVSWASNVSNISRMADFVCVIFVPAIDPLVSTRKSTDLG